MQVICSHASEPYSLVAKNIQGRWFFGEERGCTDSRSSDEGTIYSINSKGKIVTETKNRDLVTTASGLIKEIEYSNKENNQFTFVSENKNFDLGKNTLRKTTLQFDTNFNTMTIINQEIDGVETIKNNIKLSTNIAEGVGGYKCQKNLSTAKNILANEKINEFTSLNISSAPISNNNTVTKRELEAKLMFLQSEMRKEPVGNLPGGYTERGMKLQREYDDVERQIEKIDTQIKRVKQAQMDEERNIQNNKNAAAAQIAAQKAQQAREQCLSNGNIGICQSSSQNNVQFLCGMNPLVAFDNIFNQYCYTTDNYHITTTMEVRNNTGKPVKDITFNCTQYARSGTALGSNNTTIFDLWNAGETRKVSLKFTKYDQVQSMNCKASNWK